MITLEHALEVAKRLRSLMGSWPLPQEAADTIDALIAELNDERMRCAQADNAVAQMEAELAALKGQEPVGSVTSSPWRGLENIEWQQSGDIPEGTHMLYRAAGAQPYDQQALEPCEACGWKAIIPGEQCLVCERNDALAAGAQPVSHDSIEFRQFLSDVLTAAGLLEHGKQSKGLAERIAYGAVRYMAAPVQAGAQVKTETCPVCGEDAPFTGSCGGGRDNPKALCYEAAPVQQEQPCGNEAHFTTRQERAKPVQREPLFWYRQCSDGGYEGPISNGSIEDVRKRSGAWIPLVAAPVQEQRKPPADEFGWRGILAANLKCWHRMTEIESDELVAFVSRIKEPHKPLTDEEIIRIDEATPTDANGVHPPIDFARAIEAKIKEQQ